MTVSERIKRIAKKRGVSMGELANLIGTSKQSLSNILSRGDMKVSMLEDIASALNVTVPDFYQNPEEPLPDLQEVIKREVKKALQDMEGFRA